MKKFLVLLTFVLIIIIILGGCNVDPEKRAIYDEAVYGITRASTATSTQDSSSKEESTTSENSTTTEPDENWSGFHMQYGIDSKGNSGMGFGNGGFNVVSW